MSVMAKLYIGVVVTLGTIALAHGLSLWNPQDRFRFYCYLLLAMPASCLKVTLPGVTGTMSVLSLFLLAGIVELGMPETLVIGVTCVVIQCMWHARLRPRPIQIFFSVADIVLAITAAYYAYRLSSLPLLYLKTPLRLAIAASGAALRRRATSRTRATSIPRPSSSTSITTCSPWRSARR